MAQYVVSTYGSLLRPNDRTSRYLPGQSTPLIQGPVLFLHRCLRLRRRGVVVRTADAQGIHAVFQHATADTELGRGMCLDVVVLLERIENDLTLEFHDGFFQRKAAGERVVSERGGPRVVAQDGREMLGRDGVGAL